VFDGGGERAIKATRKRSFTGVVRRILDVRDGECVHPYCDQPPRFSLQWGTVSVPHCSQFEVEESRRSGGRP
jgi:hypothetical protein